MLNAKCRAPQFALIPHFYILHFAFSFSLRSSAGCYDCSVKPLPMNTLPFRMAVIAAISSVATYDFSK